MADSLETRIAARRQKDINGFTEKYQQQVDKLINQYGKQVQPLFLKIAQKLQRDIENLHNEVGALESMNDEERAQRLRYQAARLEVIKRQLLREIGNVSRLQEEALTNYIAYEYTRSYYFHAYGLEQALRLRVNLPHLTYNHVMGVLANPWLPDGKTYSDRSRANTSYFAKKIQDAITQGTAEGWSINKTAQQIKKVTGEGYYNSVRLARTEFTRAAGQGSTISYMENADILDGKRWNAVLDGRTAPKDAANDGKLYELDYDTPANPGIPGERIPNHPNCRCLWTPVISMLGVSEQERIARGAGDSLNNFGERTYTKARTYREYAKERGLPDLDTRLASDDPRKYLRRDER